MMVMISTCAILADAIIISYVVDDTPKVCP